MDVTAIIGFVIGLILWGLVAALALTAAVRSKALCREGLWEGAHDLGIDEL